MRWIKYFLFADLWWKFDVFVAFPAKSRFLENFQARCFVILRALFESSLSWALQHGKVTLHVRRRLEYNICLELEFNPPMIRISSKNRFWTVTCLKILLTIFLHVTFRTMHRIAVTYSWSWLRSCGIFKKNHQAKFFKLNNQSYKPFCNVYKNRKTH